MNGPQTIRLVGPGGAGKTTIELSWRRVSKLPSSTSMRFFASRLGDISEYIGRYGYDAYARAHVEAYYSLPGSVIPEVVASSSGFMTYARDIHPEYSRARRELERHSNTFMTLPSLDLDVCVSQRTRKP